MVTETLKKNKAVDVNEIVKSVVAFFKSNKKIKFDLSGLNSDFPILICNKPELSMIIYNIISNSERAIDKIERENGFIKICSYFDTRYYYISIEDNGIGIDKNNIKRIFEPNFSTYENGIGIGLYFVDQVLSNDRFQGEIDVKSVYGHGTTMTIKLPTYINQLNL